MPETPNRAEVTRRVEKAEKLLQKGKTADALAEYLQILESDPQNDNVRQMAADLVPLAKQRSTGGASCWESCSSARWRRRKPPGPA